LLNAVCPNCKRKFKPKYYGKGKYQKFCSKSCNVYDQHKRKEIGFENYNPNYIDGRSHNVNICKCGRKTSDYRNKLCLKCYRKKLSEQNWKGGKFISGGYMMIWKPEHPTAGQSGYIREHRLVMEQYLERLLRKKERNSAS
jgi:hypothetical protein